MVTQAQKRGAEQDFRALLEDHGLPQPDSVEYGYACVRFLWHEEKLCVAVDIDDLGAARMALDANGCDRNWDDDNGRSRNGATGGDVR